MTLPPDTPEYLTTAALHKLGFTPGTVTHLKRACGVTRPPGSRFVYVRKADLERVLAESERKGHS